MEFVAILTISSKAYILNWNVQLKLETKWQPTLGIKEELDKGVF